MRVFGELKEKIFGKWRKPQPVDVLEILDGLAAGAMRHFDWRNSIVDLMTLLGLDSSLAARQELAHELGYAGDLHDTEAMNLWLYMIVMQKLAENGGRVPEELK